MIGSLRWALRFIVLLETVSGFHLHAQLLSVHGNVSTSVIAVRYASITFVDNSDTTRRFSAMTDVLGNYQIGIVAGISSAESLPAGFELEQNYPNPFLSSTAIAYKLSRQTNAQVTIYDILGKEVRRFNLGVQQPGGYDIRWDGSNEMGNHVTAGIYFCRLEVNGKAQVKKMLLGMGQRGASALLPNALSSQRTVAVETATTRYRYGNYAVRIQNADSTFPAITPLQINNVIVQSDTTLNFTVSSANFYPAVVYADSIQQYIRGFGGANILNWRPDLTAADVAKAFGADPGQIGMSILRLRVPYNQAEFGQQVASAQLAASYGAIVMASPWTPPAWMKSNNNIVGGTLNDTSYSSYALHLKAFADFMSSSGVPLYAISVQNEPDITVTYESCSWNAQQMRTFIRNNASIIGTRIILPESFNFNHTISDAILNDSLTASNVAIIGGHIYGGGLQSYPLAASKGKELWMTEHLVLDTLWTDALGTAKEIHDCMTVGMNAYVWWYIKRFYGPVGEDGNITKRGYAMSQFARFVRPGFTRVMTTINPRQVVDVSAYKRNSQIVIVALNRNSTTTSQTFIIKNGSVVSFSPYVTSSTKNCLRESDVPLIGDNLTVTLDALSVTTFVSN